MTVAATGFAAESRADQFMSAVLRNDFTSMTAVLRQNPEVIDKHVSVAFSSREWAVSRRSVAYPLQAAILCADISVVRFLLDSGADVNLLSAYEQSPLHEAYKRPEIAALLLDRGARINHQNRFGWTALHSAAENGFLDTARLFVQREADLELRTSKGETALDLAKTPKMKELLTKEKFWRKRIDAVWMASDYASPNLLKSVPEDVARYIIGYIPVPPLYS
jgi:hypothetical protein